METVAITGQRGFIGKHLTNALVANGFIIKNSYDVDRVYHLACPSTTIEINNNTTKVMDTILDVTRTVIKNYPNSKIINASSLGAEYIDSSSQGAYNIAKRCMEIYLEHSKIDYLNYRLPAVYGPGMKDDHFIKRCIDGRAFKPTEPDRIYFIAHIDTVVDAMIHLKELTIETITLGEIYEQFTSGRRGLYRTAPSS